MSETLYQHRIRRSIRPLFFLPDEYQFCFLCPIFSPSLTIFELSSVTSSWSESSLKSSTAFKASLQKKTREKRALSSQLCRVRARASSGRREESKDVGREWQEEEVTRHVNHCTHRKVKRRKLSKGLWKDKTRLLRASENTRFWGPPWAFKASESMSSGSLPSTVFVRIRQHTAYVSITYVSIRQHTSAYVSIRPHTSV